MSEKWKVNSGITVPYIQVRDEKDDVVWDGNLSSERDAKIANIIAAAPEMLALLKTSRANVIGIIAACNCTTYEVWLGELDRVIALAEGGDA